MYQRLRGFTLIELLVVISIIATLASIMMPVFSRAREKARQITCTNNQRQIVLSLDMYAQDHEEMLPDSSNVWQAINIPEAKTFQCPTLGMNIPNAYVYNQVIAGRSLGELGNKNDTSQLLAICDGGHPATTAPLTYTNILYSGQDIDKRHFGHAECGFLDGHVILDNEITGFEYTPVFTTSLSQWSNPTKSVTPLGGHNFLGKYGNETVTLTLNLGDIVQKTQQITLTFDLYIIGNWRGNGPPDTISISNESGPIYASTYSTVATQNQAYPGAFPGGNYPMETGATSVNSLGFSPDAVYHEVLTFNHTGTTLRIQFTGSGLQAITTESWGLANLQVSGQ